MRDLGEIDPVHRRRSPRAVDAPLLLLLLLVLVLLQVLQLTVSDGCSASLRHSTDVGGREHRVDCKQRRVSQRRRVRRSSSWCMRVRVCVRACPLSSGRYGRRASGPGRHRRRAHAL